MANETPTPEVKKKRKKPRKQNEVAAESFDKMADDLIEKIPGLKVPSVYGADRAAEVAYAAARDALRIQAGVFRREADRVRKKR